MIAGNQFSIPLGPSSSQWPPRENLPSATRGETLLLLSFCCLREKQNKKGPSRLQRVTLNTAALWDLSQEDRFRRAAADSQADVCVCNGVQKLPLSSGDFNHHRDEILQTLLFFFQNTNIPINHFAESVKLQR